MTWDQIKVELSRVVSGSVSICDIVCREELWNSKKSLLVRAALYLHEHEKLEECIRFINAIKVRALSLSSKTEINLQYVLGDAFLGLGQYNDALVVYGEILKREPSDVAYANQALAYWELGHFQNALDNYLEAIRLNPHNVVALRGAGEMLNKLGHFRNATRYLLAATKRKPKYSAAYTALGVAYYNLGEWLKSYRALKRAVQLDPEDKIAALGVAKIEQHFEL